MAADSTSEIAHVLAWLQAVSGGDDRTIRDVRARTPAMHPSALGWIVFHALLLGVDMDGAEAALSALQPKARSDLERRNYHGRLWEYLGNRGRLGEMQDDLEARAREMETFGPVEELGMSAELRARLVNAERRIHTALFWGGDTTGIGDAAAHAEQWYRRSPAPDSRPFVRWVVAQSACVAGMGRIMTGDTTRARAAVGRLFELLDDPLDLRNRAAHASCAATLDAVVAAMQRRPDARALAERADSVLRYDPPLRIDANRMQLLLARTFDALDDPETALRVLRRREIGNPAFYLATILREEGRLAARLGDRSGAIRAYSQYLALRTDPDAALLPEVQQVRHELSELRLNR